MENVSALERRFRRLSVVGPAWSVWRGRVRKTQDGAAVPSDMDESGSRPATGQRVRTRLDGQAVRGTVESVTYTPKKGNLIAKVSLDEPGPNGQEALAVALDDLDEID